ncbi:MAG: hypothetical protein JW850_04390 [Thermoflexales bacterium]|nr:hypothetical protein [Thermoflexales bacterium]
MQNTTRSIGTLHEGPLHAGLKAWYAQPGDQVEANVDGYIVDIVRCEAPFPNGVLIEIQTGSFRAIKAKLAALVAHHPLRLVYPVAWEKWIVKEGQSQRTAEDVLRRKSPKRGRVEQVFDELVSFPRLVGQAGFSLDVLFIREEEVRCRGGRSWRRRGWVTRERRLLEVVGQQRFETVADMAALLPAGLLEPFTVTDLGRALGLSRRLAGKMAYCLREMGVLERRGKRGRAVLYGRADGAYEADVSPETGSPRLATHNSEPSLLRREGRLATPLPFDEPDVRAYVDTLFLEGKLEQVPLPESWSIEG